MGDRENKEKERDAFSRESYYERIKLFCSARSSFIRLAWRYFSSFAERGLA
jgi:hypothetical protein